MKHRDQDCPFCRMMRALAFSGVGMVLGTGSAYLLGASKETMVYIGIITATIIVFGVLGRQQDNKR